MCFCCLFIGREEFSFICLHGASGFGWFFFVGFGGVFVVTFILYLSGCWFWVCFVVFIDREGGVCVCGVSCGSGSSCLGSR